MHRIYRRLFNPPEDKPVVKQLVAMFTPSSKKEADFLLTSLQQLSTAFKATDFSEWRYTMESDPPAPKHATLADKDITVDLSNARPTKRRIAYTLSWRPSPTGATCIMLAMNRYKGCIRGEVPNTPEGRNFFKKRVLHVWPNAEIEKA